MEVECLFLGRVLCRNSGKLLCINKMWTLPCVWTASTKIIQNYSMLNSGRILVACFLVFTKCGTFIIQPEWSHIWNERSDNLRARKLKLMLSVTALWIWRLSFPSLHSSSSANCWDDNLGCCAHEQAFFLSMARVFSLTWFVLLNPEDSLSWLSVIVCFATCLLLFDQSASAVRYA